MIRGVRKERMEGAGGRGVGCKRKRKDGECAAGEDGSGKEDGGV